ncbi:DUF7837 family putative zinc-binding protein [Halapricum hydrolyticum]|uniref:DUF7837 domain-containing protein n=1 Tax=Halapricum hydrolyticum TaxID=2979991 RepID=A0AAE3ID02_9EURY|nr:hypothetical protein [Halapricum hydrolyticum]MCU4718973.1 hypothetical protein [Halapricum hydrolyticum]MCU4727902.1 hypothetical protein [Halapricum hydrolyticum]
MDRTGDRGNNDLPLGECPDCQATVPRENLLIRYVPREGWPRILAECSECETAVSPE